MLLPGWIFRQATWRLRPPLSDDLPQQGLNSDSFKPIVDHGAHNQIFPSWTASGPLSSEPKPLQNLSHYTDIGIQQMRDSHTHAQHDDFEPEDETMADDYEEADDDENDVGGAMLNPPPCLRSCMCQRVDSFLDSRSPYRSSAHEILRPLQATADRVAKQVEEFAQVMDQFVSTRKSDDDTLWNDALLLLGTYNDICTHRRTRTSTSDPDAQIQKIQLEADLWLLVRGVLSISSPEVTSRARNAQETRLGDLSRYSANSTLWEAFLDSDGVAQHYECILDWLQEGGLHRYTYG